MMVSYSEKLRDPRWQRKRLEIMQRDGFTCQLCKSKTDTLNVHHLAYGPGDPWDCDDLLLVTLCEECHSLESFERVEIEKDLISALRSKGYSMSDLINLRYRLPIKNIGDETVIKKVIDLFYK